jgi:uncharacterized repeat protein (TIGR01451 family)
MRASHVHGSATVWTDKPNYGYWETVIISGSGFKLNTNIVLTITRPDSVVDTRSTTSDSSGNFICSYVLDGIIGTYTVAATDGTNTASKTFTELSVDWVQGHDDTAPHDGTVDVPMVTWAPGDINPQNSILTEGNIVPPYPSHIPGHVNYRVIIRDKDLDAGTYVLTIAYDFTKGGKVAFDFLTTNYGITDNNLKTQLPGWSDPTQISFLVTAGPSTLAFPTDSFALPSGLGGGTVEDRQNVHDTAFTGFNPREMKLYGATIDSITQGVHTGDITGNSGATVAIAFTKTTDDDWPIIATWGGHLGIGVASPEGYGTGNGAGSITGAPFHMSLDSLKDSTGKDIVSGERDRSVQMGPVFVPAKISGYKFNDLNGNGVWDKPSEPALSGWTITLSGPISDTKVTDVNGYYEFTGLTAGTYTISEALQAGWIQTAPTPAPPGTYTVSITTSGQVVTGKDFGNFKQVTIEAGKWNDLDGDGVKEGGEPEILGWKLTLTYPDLSTSTKDSQASWTVNKGGKYTITEELQAGWVHTTASSVDLNVQSGDTPAKVWFGNFKVVTITADLSITKSGPQCAHVGDSITYTFAVSNAGPDSATGVVVTDSKAGTATYISGDTNSNGKLDVTETWTFTASYTILGTDPDPLSNTATISSSTSDPDPSNNQASWSVDILHPAITVTKTADKTTAHVGDTITYTIKVSNPSADTTMTKVSVIDTLLGDISADFATLAAGASQTKTYAHTLVSGDADPLTNTVTVKYKDSQNTEKTASASWTVTRLPPPPTVNLKAIGQSASPSTVAQGETVHITVTVKNTGTTTETFNVDLKYDGTLIHTWTGVILGPGAQTDLTWDWVTSSIPPGTYSITAVVDPANLITETDETDNTCTVPSAVTIKCIVCKPPVGGEWVPYNKSELLAPWLSSVVSLITVATSFVYVKRRKKQQN